NPGALDARNRATNHDEATVLVGLDHHHVLRGHLLGAEMARHLLVLEYLARVLAVTGRPDRAVAHRNAVGGAKSREVPALHAAGEALAHRGARHVDELAGDEVVHGDLRAHRNGVL